MQFKLWNNHTTIAMIDQYYKTVVYYCNLLYYDLKASNYCKLMYTTIKERTKLYKFLYCILTNMCVKRFCGRQINKQTNWLTLQTTLRRRLGLVNTSATWAVCIGSFYTELRSALQKTLQILTGNIIWRKKKKKEMKIRTHILEQWQTLRLR